MLFHFNRTQIDETQWHELLDNSSVASYFQTLECYNFYTSLSFMTPFVFGVSENNKLVGLLCGYLIADGNNVKRFFSRRAIVPGGLLLHKDISQDALKMLLTEAVSHLRKKTIYIEIRNYNDYSSFVPTLDAVNFNYKPHFNFHVATPNVESTFSALSDSKKRQIKTAQKTGVEWSETTNKQEIGAFYILLKQLYATKIKLPLFPLEFFEKLVELPNGKLLVVKHEGELIGGMACVSYSGKVVYEWFVCGDESKRDVYASVVATWAGLEYAAVNNYERFDFMGAGKPQKSYGVRKFKSKFGGERIENGRFLYLCKPLLYTLGKTILTIKKIS
ncbi:MAG: GNAT family N-acetyltransferase [Paludibacter sp.]|nr:GNAT family N-acetyltransferase [Paludibacter sp.]